MALYNDHEYKFLEKSDGTYALYTNDSNARELGFKKVTLAEERYMKIVNLEELTFVFEKYTEAIYKGDTFIASIIDNDQVMLYTRNVLLGKKHNMIMRDKDEYYIYVKLKNIDCMIQKWMPCKKYNI